MIASLYFIFGQNLNFSESSLSLFAFDCCLLAASASLKRFIQDDGLLLLYYFNYLLY